ncbi:MAG: hypothetical protein JWN82_374 [Candidatus Saccharibacteria bacterium]|nr:hypothetical protein [Candidatus Saccharibacteria bacterium]
MKIIRTLLLLTLLVGVFMLLASPHASAAWNPFSGVDCTTGNGSAVCEDKGTGADPISGPHGLIIKVVNIVAFIGGLAAVIIIVLAGLRFITSGGSSEDVAGARRALIYAAVGLAVLALARTLVVFIINRI